MTLLPTVTFLIYPGAYFLSSHKSSAPILSDIILFVLSSSFLFTSYFKNPGFIPRQIPPFAYGPLDSTPLDQLERKVFMSKKININEKLTLLKYCPTCLIYRPPRSSHCSVCGVCVENFDHHCPWVGNCIGKMNHYSFYGFLFFTLALDTNTLVFSYLHLENFSNSSGLSVLSSPTSATGPSLALIIYTFIVSPKQVLIFLTIMFSLHTYLLFSNQTTRELLKSESKNPFTTQPLKKTMKNYFCPKTNTHFDQTCSSGLSVTKFKSHGIQAYRNIND